MRLDDGNVLVVGRDDENKVYFIKDQGDTLSRVRNLSPDT
jgi:hypothetical protein